MHKTRFLEQFRTATQLNTLETATAQIYMLHAIERAKTSREVISSLILD